MRNTHLNVASLAAPTRGGGGLGGLQRGCPWFFVSWLLNQKIKRSIKESLLVLLDKPIF